MEIFRFVLFEVCLKALGLITNDVCQDSLSSVFGSMCWGNPCQYLPLEKGFKDTLRPSRSNTDGEHRCQTIVDSPHKTKV